MCEVSALMIVVSWSSLFYELFHENRGAGGFLCCLRVVTIRHDDFWATLRLLHFLLLMKLVSLSLERSLIANCGVTS